nr:flagellar basal-body protein FlbY [Brevundimonas lenta]
MIDLTDRLTARLVEEAAAFESHRPQDVAATLAATQDLANAYRRESARVKADPASIAPAPLAERNALIKATETFEGILTRHSRAIEAARVVSEGLVRTIAEEVAGQRVSPSAYGASGRANAGDSRAVTFNRMA